MRSRLNIYVNIFEIDVWFGINISISNNSKQYIQKKNTSLIRLLPPLIKIFPKKENAEQKKRKCGKVFFYVLELSYDSKIIKQTST